MLVFLICIKSFDMLNDDILLNKLLDYGFRVKRLKIWRDKV